MAESVTKKRVLVRFGENCKSVVPIPCENSSSTERDLLEESVAKEFRDLISENDRICLQLKDEEWDGMFVDFREDVVPDRSIFRIVVSKVY